MNQFYSVHADLTSDSTAYLLITQKQTKGIKHKEKHTMFQLTTRHRIKSEQSYNVNYSFLGNSPASEF